MKTSWIDRETSEIVDEEEKMREINEELERFKKECQGEKTSEEKDDFVNRFEEYMDKCGPVFEFKMLPAIDGATVVGAAKAAALLFGFFQNMSPEQVKECFKACADAFAAELERQIHKCKTERNHQVH